ncbi:bestrophin-1-like [Uranotaenia lowii]|uniref:bestrophin-1-like n=1 Tax=Uranotaenia lowii TaxID=190385 RepID=UPI00247A1EBA|nr:bestrophin-1-like [Uranotaenia lowii]
MTISYSAEVPNGSNFGCFWRILWKWRGSVYKAVWRELVAYLGVYFTLNLTYRFYLDDEGRRVFEKIKYYCGQQKESVTLSLVLGFYVRLVVKRWWEQYRLLPWPDTLALFVSAAIQGHDETGRLMRRNIMRYMVLSYVITLQKISLRVKRRFPTWQHLVDAGLMLESERKIFDKMDAKSPMSKYWMPLVWATNIINRARKDELIPSDHIVQTLLMELSDIRRRLGGLIGYDTVCVPLVYTQVVTLVLYTYFTAVIMRSQMIPTDDPLSEEIDLYFPVFTVLQFVFYVGWLKVAEVLINPFGEDDDDIELNWLIDRHIKASYMIVDEMHDEHPELLKDQYWEEVVPSELPYTVASEFYRREEPKGSAENYLVKESEAVYANVEEEKSHPNDDTFTDYESVNTFTMERPKGWFSRQISRISMQSTTGDKHNRGQQNWPISNPDVGLSMNNFSTGTTPSRVSILDKFVYRRQNSKLNLHSLVITHGTQKSRSRISTPDIAKDSRKYPLTSIPLNTSQPDRMPNIASGVALMTSQLASNPFIFPITTMPESGLGHGDVPVVGTLLLAPIEELKVNSAVPNNPALEPSTTVIRTNVKPILPINNVTEINYANDGPSSGLEVKENSSSVQPMSNVDASTIIVVPIKSNVASRITGSDGNLTDVIPSNNSSNTRSSNRGSSAENIHIQNVNAPNRINRIYRFEQPSTARSNQGQQDSEQNEVYV